MTRPQLPLDPDPQPWSAGQSRTTGPHWTPEIGMRPVPFDQAYQSLDPDPLTVIPPDLPPKRRGCLALLDLLFRAVVILAVLAAATPQTQKGGDPRDNALAAIAINTLPVAAPTSEPVSGYGMGQPVQSAPAASSGSGTALFQTTATWCGPTKTRCHGWGGNARLAALPGFSGKPYTVLVSYGSRRVLVSVVSVCWCGIDLSPSAFRVLAPLAKGRIVVLVEGPITLPATDTR